MDANKPRTAWDTDISHLTRTDPIRALGLCLAMSFTAEDLTRAAVIRARSDGRSWEEIGVALGTTKQAAQQRFRSIVLHEERLG